MERECGGTLRMNAARLFDLPIISIGEVCPERLEGAAAWVLAQSDGVYRKLVFHRGRLAGALLFGDISGAGVFYRLYRDQPQVEEDQIHGLQAVGGWEMNPRITRIHVD